MSKTRDGQSYFDKNSKRFTMDTEKCRVLFEILKCGSFSAAAEKTGYTPSGLSRMIASMEEDSGFPLLIRSREGVCATKECEIMIPIYREFIAVDEKYRQTKADVFGIQTGTVVVGTAYSIYYKWFSTVIADFKREYPGIEVRIADGKSSELYRMIAAHEMDFCIVSKRDGDVSWYHLFDDPLVAIVSADSHLSRMKCFPVKSFETESYIETFKGQDTDNARMFRKNHMHPNIQFETEDTYASYRMVEAGLGVSLSNYIESKERNEGKSVRFMELEPPQIVEIGIATPTDAFISPAAKKFRNFAMKYIEDIMHR